LALARGSMCGLGARCVGRGWLGIVVLGRGPGTLDAVSVD